VATTYRLMTAPSGTVHLAAQGNARRPAPTSLCGRDTLRYAPGEETEAASEVSCGSCRKIIEADNRSRAYAQRRREGEES
jgi:hypothetical protein